MSNSIIFNTNSTQTSIEDEELIQKNKPLDYNGTFIANYFDFYNTDDCHVLLNDNTNEMFIPAGGYEFGTIYQLRTFKIVENGIHYNYSGIASESITPITSSNGSAEYLIGLFTPTPEIVLNEGDTKQLEVIGVRRVLYQGTRMPINTKYISSNTNVAIINDNGLVSYVGSGICKITIINGQYYDIVEVTCI